jgi:hypothetical protein
MNKINLKKFTYNDFVILIVFSIFLLIMFYFFTFSERHRVSKLKSGGATMGFDIEKGTFSVGISLPEAEFYSDDSVKTAIIDVTDKTTGNKIIGFEIDFIPGKYRWVCNSFTDLKNYQNGEKSKCNDVLKSYFSEKIRYMNSDSKKLQAILSVGLASQEGILDVQEELSDKRAVILYDAINEYLDTEKLKIPTMKLSFGQYTGKSTDKCDTKTDEQRIIAFIRVYDSNIEISDANYVSFQKMLYEVYEVAFNMNKIPLNGLNYSRFRQKDVFLERRFL